MKKFWTWFLGFFEDQTGYASAKRAVLYWAMGLLSYMTIKGVNGNVITMEMFWGVVGLVLAGLGLVTSEFFKSKLN
jgi:hypothetical protein